MFDSFVKRKGSKGLLPFIIGLVLVLLLSGCGSGKKADDNGGVPDPSQTDELQPSSGTESEERDEQPSSPDTVSEKGGESQPSSDTESKEKDELPPAEEPKETATEQTDDAADPDEGSATDDKGVKEEYYDGAPDFADFQPVDRFFIDYAFDIAHDEDSGSYTIHGAYDLDGDGKDDEINAVLTSYYTGSSTVEIDGSKLEHVFENFTGNVYLIDLDSRDSYIEIAFEDAGPSADYALELVRYDGTDARYLGSISRLSYLDGQGKYISWFYTSKEIRPTFFSAWEELTDGKWIMKKNPVIEQSVGKTYSVSGQAYFIPLDKMPGDMAEFFGYVDWNPDIMRMFDETEIKILNIYLDDTCLLNWFYIELADGERGLLYFWVGD